MAVSVGLGLILLIIIPVHALWRSIGDHPPRSRIARYRITILEAAVLLAMLLVVAHIENISAGELGLGLTLRIEALVGLAIAIVICIGLGAASMVTDSSGRDSEPSEADFLKPNTQGELRYFIVMVLLIGFAWEVLYRGFLFWWLNPLLGTPLTVLVSGFSYGLAHGWENSRQGIGSIVSALVFATGYALTQSLWWLIIIHVALPLIGFAALRMHAGKPRSS